MPIVIKGQHEVIDVLKMQVLVRQLKYVNTQTTKIIEKQRPIDFYCTIFHKVDKYIDIMQKFFKTVDGK